LAADPGLSAALCAAVHAPPPAQPELMAMGAVAFVNKPFSLESIALSIRRALDDRSTPEAAFLQT